MVDGKKSTWKTNTVTNNQVIGVIMVQNKIDAIEFGKTEEGLLRIFGDFLSVALANTELQQRAIQISTSVHAEFSGMSEKIDELMTGKQALHSAEGMLLAEEETGRARQKAIYDLMSVEKELDKQADVVDALLH